MIIIEETQRPKSAQILALTSLVVLCAVMAAGPAAGQTAPPPPRSTVPASAQPGRSVEEVVVTSRKRSERLINVPISETAVSAARLQEADIRDVKSVAAIVPNLYVDAVAAGPRISIRGLGNPQTGGVVDSSVGLAIDGLFYGRPDWLTEGLFDVQTLEVLRGPQSTYFGRNTTAGLVDIRTKGATDTWQGYVQTGVEAAIGGYSGEGAISGPLTDKLGVRLAYRHSESDGYIKLTGTDHEAPVTTSDMLRLTLDWKPTDNIRALYKFTYFNAYEKNNDQVIGACGPAFLALLAEVHSNENCKLGYQTAPNGPIPGGVNPRNFFTQNTGYATSLTLTDDVGLVVLTSETGLYHLDTKWSADGSWDALVQTFTTNRPEKFTQFSQEFRVTSQDNQPITYLLGAYIDTSYRQMNQNIDIGPLLGGPTSVIRPLYVQEYSYSGFGDVAWHITQALSLDFGGRYTYEIQHGTVTQYAGPIGDPAFLSYNQHQTLPSKDFTPAVTLQWKYSAFGQVYFSYKEGFKAGGFNLDSGTGGGSFDYGDESAKSFELGTKASLLDRKLLLTAALFDTEISNLQVQSYNGTSPTATILNAAGARVRGAELEAAAVLIPGLNADFNLGYTDAIYTAFPKAPCYLGQTPGQGCSAVTATQNLTNATLPIAPKFSGSFGMDWSHPALSDHILKVGGDITYRSKVYLDLEEDPLELSKALPLADFHIALVPAAQRGWTAGVVIRNAFDRLYVTGAVNLEYAKSYVYDVGVPRTVEFQLGYRF